MLFLFRNRCCNGLYCRFLHLHAYFSVTPIIVSTFAENIFTRMEHYTRFADPMVDWTFKRIFGTEQYKDATIGLLNSLITDRQVRDVSFLNVEEAD